MQYFIVVQNESFEEEYLGNYLWAPNEDKRGNKKFFWENMNIINIGDIIFSLYERKIVSLNISESVSAAHETPFIYSKYPAEKRDGKIVYVNYNKFNNAISIDDYIDDILRLCPEKYSPINKIKNKRTNINSVNQGYLYKIDEKLGLFLIELINKNNSDFNLDEIIKSNNYINKIKDIPDKILEKTEKEALIKTRISQNVFKNKLLSRSKKCEICGLDIPELLVASHCKPWSQSNNYEKQDKNNGLLLCVNHDRLFDKGFITFEDSGKIIISEKISNNNYKMLNINKDIKINLTEDQKKYIKYHRENIFIN